MQVRRQKKPQHFLRSAMGEYNHCVFFMQFDPRFGVSFSLDIVININYKPKAILHRTNEKAIQLRYSNLL